MNLYLKEEIERFRIKSLENKDVFTIDEVLEKFRELEMDLETVNEEMRELRLDLENNYARIPDKEFYEISDKDFV